MKFARVGRFMVGSLVSLSLSVAHVSNVHANQITFDSQQRRAGNQSTSSTDLKTIAKLPYTTPVITSHKSFNFEVQPSSPAGSVKGATSPVTGLPMDTAAIGGGILAAVGGSLMLYGRRKSSRKSSKED